MQEIMNKLKSMNDTLNKLITFIKSLSNRLDKLEEKVRRLK